MGLRAKFNLTLLGAFVIGLALAALISYRLVYDNARREVLDQASIMIEQAAAIRNYTATEINPLLADQLSRRFLPHSVPSFAAQTILRGMAARLSDYSYKEATLNATNPADRATDWEADIIREFRLRPDLKELSSIRETQSGPVITVSRPIRIVDKDCLVCHSVPSAAPASMIAVYGTANGFGWKQDEVVGAQIVSVPMAVALERARSLFVAYLGGLTAVFLLTLTLLNVALHFMIIRPIRQMSTIAEAVSMGDVDAPEFEEKGRDEIASLAQSFNRMRRSVTNAMRMLDR